ncbi:MAG TPA: hypothetical protein VFG69_06045, partial [Nannocystaceae bacterium]|nr:hypothetical protein [Nannocystaceae bacterium]
MLEQPLSVQPVHFRDALPPRLLQLGKTRRARDEGVVETLGAALDDEHSRRCAGSRELGDELGVNSFALDDQSRRSGVFGDERAQDRSRGIGRSDQRCAELGCGTIEDVARADERLQDRIDGQRRVRVHDLPAAALRERP